ncbi:hypothetical protein [Atlantibacter sp.]|uniref:hypothetical protein n=1 Tax=Atlantibacter sp. TaxID=1903473 RepID=UPI0028AA3D63|nr:hypothetical protein [Atlantibacter sp.]
MPVKIKNIPGPALRPAPPKLSRWLAALAYMVACGILLIRFLDKYIENDNFWWFAIGIPMGGWGIFFVLRMSLFGLRHMRANAYDRRREQYILKQIRRGRRALQILAAECATAHALDLQFTTIAEPLLRNINVLFPQTTREGGDNIRHSHLPITEGKAVASDVTTAFNALLKKIAVQLAALPENPVAVLLESSSSLPEDEIKALWLQAWQKSGMSQPTDFVSGQGLMAIDHWLDHRIHENTLLLVVALQIAPELPEMTAEVVVGLLLGNRLTQKRLMPQALLHRPEASGMNAAALQEGVLQAAGWVPLTPNGAAHLWLTGLDDTSDIRSGTIIVQGKPPLTSIKQDAGLHDFSSYLGNPGCAAPWLAIAVAAQIISDDPLPHMIISGEQGSDIVWSTVVSPYASHKESNL